MDRSVGGEKVRSVGTAVVGGGPAGLTCALELARAGRSVALFEQGGKIADSLCPKMLAGMQAHRVSLRKAERYRDQCGRCTCLQGIGGAALHFDSNLGYVRKLSRPKIEAAPDGKIIHVNVLERLFDSMEKAERLISDAYAMLAMYGLTIPSQPSFDDHPELADNAHFSHIDTADSLPAPLILMMPIVEAIEQALQACGGALVLRSRIVRLSSAQSDSGAPRWMLECEAEDGTLRAVYADNVVLAVGKTAMPWIRTLIDDLNVRHQAAASVDLGVRLETRRADMEWMTRSCHYPKMTFLSPRGEAVRTFCVCAGGRMMQYEFAGSVILDGQHCIADPTDRTNFGILTSVKVPAGTDAAEYGLGIARKVNRLGETGPLVQTVGDLVAGWPTRDLAGLPLRSSLVRPTLGDLRACLPDFLVEDILEMIARINRLSPGAIKPYALLAAPVVERAFPSIELSSDLESSRRGIYFAGDCTGRVIGIPYAMATGLCVGRAILTTEASVPA